MDGHKFEGDIDLLISELGNHSVDIRSRAVGKVLDAELNEERVTRSLIEIANSDPNDYVRRLARNTLDWLNVEYSITSAIPVTDFSTPRSTSVANGQNEINESVRIPEPVTDFESFTRRYRLQILGFIGWFVLASVLAPFSYGLITTPATVISLFVFGFSKQQKGVASGVLIAVSLNFFVALVRGLSMNAFCFIPFYYFG